MRAKLGAVAIIFLTWSPATCATESPVLPRRVVSLDGVWQVAEGSKDEKPATFYRGVPVPGLVDMARPAFEGVGTPGVRREAFWYRKLFTLDGAVPEVAMLKIGKARYGTHVWLNGKDLGEHVACFTSVLFDVKPFLRPGGMENELVVRVGADRKQLPPGVPGGWDFEKYKYIPGIYDSVELVLTGYPFIRNVQVVPDITRGTVRAVVELQNGSQAGQAAVSLEVGDSKGEGTIGKDNAERPLKSGEVGTTELSASIPNARLWSPEDPYLYRITVSTGRDALQLRFGMREFRFDPKSRRAILNGKPYYLRGTNVCIYRFFEDDARGDKPWREDWVRKLHRQFRTMHWNSIRYCIGFPPERWYDIADEEGFLIQDEFPIWLLDPEGKEQRPDERPTAEQIVPQYIEWMRERWNHPCVVIWDGQNESFTPETGKAIRAVRHLDLSNRPWENGWEAPQSPTDCVESHPYLFSRGWERGRTFRLSEMPGVSGRPHLQKPQQERQVPIIINEYCWLWLNRDGTPTTLTKRFYEGLLGPGSTTEQRRLAHARNLAALTEFWRCHRECAGVLHFCGLGYSRSGEKPRPEGGATSDHWVDLEALAFEPLIGEYVKEAFSPVGLMVDFWAERVEHDAKKEITVFAINDLESAWSGPVVLKLLRGSVVVAERSQECRIEPWGRTIMRYSVKFPSDSGAYTVVAELQGSDGQRVRSLRDVVVEP